MSKRSIKVKKPAGGESGYALIMVLLLLLLGSLLIIPFLGMMTSGLETGSMYEGKTDELYAADAGIEAGIWRIKYDYWNPADHDYYDYNYNKPWIYETETVNGMTAEYIIENVWIPYGVPAPSAGDAEDIIESEKLVVAGTSGADPEQPYRIMISYTPDAGEELTVTSVGVWLPRGFNYVDDSCTLEEDPYYYEGVPSPCPGGQAIVWNTDCYFTELPEFADENGVMSTSITFSYAPPAEQPDSTPAAIAWITTGDADLPVSWDVDTRIFKITSAAGDTSVDAYLTKCELRRMGNAMSGDYVAIGNSLLSDDNGNNKRETPHTPSIFDLDTIPPDADVVAAYLYWSGWFNEDSKQPELEDDCSSFSPNWNPGTAWDDSQDYFRGSKYHVGEGTELISNTISLGEYEDTAAAVSVAWWHWETDNVENSDGLDFAISADGGDTWSDFIEAFRNEKNEPASLDYYNSNRFEYDIPNEYLTDSFRLKFKLVGFEEDDGYCCIDGFDVKVMLPDDEIIFKIGEYQVYFNEDKEPSDGTSPLTTECCYVMRNTMWGNPYGFSYASKRDVTALVRTYTDEGEPGLYPGNAVYTVDGVDADNRKYSDTSDDSDFAFAGWSLVIVYTSPQTAGHYIYIRDDNFAFHPGTGGNLDFDEDGNDGGDITNFVVPKPIKDKYGVVIETVAAKLTCFVVEGDNSGTSSIRITGQQSEEYKDLSNPESPANDVWNSKSYPGTFNEGVDIDTFELLWSDGVLTPNDKILHIDMFSNNDAWNLVYFIISVRSETRTGGTQYYVIGGG